MKVGPQKLKLLCFWESSKASEGRLVLDTCFHE